jgi:hypothetical protein
MAEQRGQGVLLNAPQRARSRADLNVISKLRGLFSTPPTGHELVEMGKVGIFLPGIWPWLVWVR